MPQSLKERIILWIYAWWRHRHHTHVLDVGQAFRRAERLLICLPADASDAAAAMTVIPSLIMCLQSRIVTLVIREESRALCERLEPSVRVITIGPDDRRWSGFPATKLVKRVKLDGVDAAIDFSPRLDMLTASLCVRTGAPLRIGLHDPYSELFFNVQLAVPSQDLSDGSDQPLYPRLLRMIEGLMGGERREGSPQKLA